MSRPNYLHRLVDSTLRELFSGLPAIMIEGPRASGKTTTARQLARDILRLDDPMVRDAVAANPDAALRRVTEPVLIDEWQEVPGILGAIKRAVDADPRPGRFILTGSVAAKLTQSMWPGTGRVINLPLHSLTQREVLRRTDRPGLLPLIISGDLEGVSAENIELDGYVDLALRSGFPEPALNLRPQDRGHWLTSYVDHVVTRDIGARSNGRDPVRLRRYLEALGLSTAGLPSDETLLAACDINARTAREYDELLANLYLVENIPHWSTNGLSQMTKRPKRNFGDAGLAMAAARVNLSTIMRNSDLLGRVIDTFVTQQIRPEAALLAPPARLHHLRTRGGREEIDLILDLGAHRIIAMEIKASASLSPRDAKHLIWLRERIGEDFVRGVVFYTGRFPYEVDRKIWALPISSLWGS
ncbi:MAG: ATP-binding protein [Angustibacter sp.]